MRILCLEPFHGGSHRQFLEQWQRHTTISEFEVIGLPARSWKWRMAASAWELARQLKSAQPPDILFVSDYVDLPALFGFLPQHWAHVRSVVYFHENQLTYPEKGDVPVDLQYGWTNMLSCLRASTVIFNSRYQLEAFRAAALEFCRRLPKPNPRLEIERALEGAEVVWPGIDLCEFPLGQGGGPGTPLRLVFNHRWEHDKGPERFLDAALELDRTGHDFQLILLGHRFENSPPGCPERLRQLGPARVLIDGHLERRAEYAKALGQADVLVSTASHEFYGMSVLEGLAAGCRPCLPNGLSYPEIIGPAPPAGVFHESFEELVQTLQAFSRAPATLRLPGERAAWRERAEAHTALATAKRLDALVCSSA